MKKLLLLLSIFFLLVPMTKAQKPSTDDQSWGFYAEKQFRDLYTSCQLINAQEKFLKLVKKESMIPFTLRQTIGVDPSLKIVPKAGANLSLIFDFIYDGKKTTNIDRLNSVSAANPKDKFGVTSLDLVNFGVSPNSRNIVYRQTCAGTAIAGLSAKFDFISVGNASAQVNADADAKSEFLLVRSAGFESPMFTVLHGGQSPAKVSVMMQLWSKWVDPSDTLNKANTEPQYLTGFQGMMISVGSRSKTSFGSRVGAEAGTSLPVFSIKGSGEVTYNTSTSIVINSPDVLFETQKVSNQDNPIMFFEAVPPPADIITFAAALKPITEGGTELSSGNTYSQTVTINGIPQSMCEENAWSVEEKDLDSRKITGNEMLNLSLTSSAGNYTANKGCSFVVSTGKPLDPSSPLFGKNTLGTTYPLNYSIVYGKAFTKGSDTSHVKFNVDSKLPRQLDFIPTVVGGSKPSVISEGQQAKKIQWVQSFRIIDLKSQIASGKLPSINNVKTSCPYVVSTGGTGTGGALDNGIFEITASIPLEGEKKLAGVNGPTCQIQFDVQLPKKDNSFTPAQTITFDVPSAVVAPENVVVTVQNPTPAPSPQPPQQ